MAPVQMVLIPIADRHLDYARDIASQLREHGFRVEVDDSQGRVGAKVRQATTQKVPWMLVVGDRDIAQSAVSVRLRTGEDLGAMHVADFITLAKTIVANKSLALA